MHDGPRRTAPTPEVSDRRLARELMEEFASGTGLASGRPPRRYLWTDAFAVCNYLGLWLTEGDDRDLELALKLVSEVHRVLGRHRADDARRGWLSGLPDAAAARHPTAAGLRIGKPLPERAPGERLDPSLEWDRDGQYYHYLTKWMHALHRVHRVTGRPEYHRWAAELGLWAHHAFTHGPPGRRALYWKLSIDGSRPLVASAGHHDPLDGLLTLATLQVETPAGAEVEGPDLRPATTELLSMCRGREWATEDPLGAGGLLVDAWRCWKLADRLPGVGSVAGDVVRDAIVSYDVARTTLGHRRGTAGRLAFRELGFVIGIRAAHALVGGATRAGTRAGPWPGPTGRELDALSRGSELAEGLERFWADARHREPEAWAAHRDISQVMLATCLVPEGFLGD
ncbi:MAG: hypothetical protein P8188_00795 [Gemmatimonadota bacterium]|jgi:hypothetical protein